MKKVIDKNKKAYFDYFIEETIEAGICLIGSEVKSVKNGDVNLADSFCFLEKNELFLKNCYVKPYDKGSAFNEDARRDRKLLLNRQEIDKLEGKIRNKGFTVVPTQIYISGRLVKVEIALCKGKQLHDKRDSLREKDLRREAERDIKNYGK